MFVCFCEIESNTFLVFVLALTFADLAWLGLTMQCLTDDDGIVECQTVEVDDEGGENGEAVDGFEHARNVRVSKAPAQKRPKAELAVRPKREARR